ncbi:MFS general substrate transporter [Rhizoclosmatium globosum]|uniref:MFS general substrate transporter n=1 Tax=Rhizoclosmatium globosum TaxID=329046 RepID=A0A1Y2CBV5_9FUNG|nr:MFS general substrate transporter [Rhizoclosmatium globosum]|eukprot:ORY44406.1 MFS general substrate transporter [Rhizoclosmatium globosum]
MYKTSKEDDIETYIAERRSLSLHEDDFLQATSSASFTKIDDLAAAGINIDEESLDEQEYPDGGMKAWLVVLGSFVAHFLVYGMVYSFGVYNSYYRDLGVGSGYQVAMIGSVGIASIDFLGLISSSVAERFGFRPVIFVGTIVMALGLLLSSFTTSLPLLILTQGIVFGIGASFVYLPAVSLPSQWFLKRRGLATGIAVSGSGFGGLCWSRLDLRITAIICVVGMLPFVPFMKTRIPPRKGKTSYEFLKKAGFYCLFFACFWASFCEFVSVDFLTVFASQRVGLTLSDGATIMSVYNGFNIVGRLAMGFFSDHYLGPLNTMMLCLWLTVVSVFAWLAGTSFVSLAGVAAAIGFFDGGFWALFPVATMEMFGTEGSLVTMLATMYTFVTFANFGSPPLSGFIEERYGWDWMIVYGGCLAVLAAVAGSAARFVHSKVLFTKV